jgi:hypothetical protein
MGIHISPRSKSWFGSLRQGRPDLRLMRNRGCPDRQDVFNPVLPQLQRHATDSNRPLFSASLPRNLDERVDQFGEGTALGLGERPPQQYRRCGVCDLHSLPARQTPRPQRLFPGQFAASSRYNYVAPLDFFKQMFCSGQINRGDIVALG